MYFGEENPFEEVIEFQERLKESYKIEFLVFKKESNISRMDTMKNGLKNLTESHGMKGIIMGTRATDPYCSKLTHLCKSNRDSGWGDFTRVIPILDWSYSQIWDFLKENQLYYCDLYEKGYTYLGDKHDTTKNPFLLKTNLNKYERDKIAKHDLESLEEYLPAYYAIENYEGFSRKSNTHDFTDD